jgi:hypothetical protein
VHGMDQSLLVSAGIAIAGVLLSLLFLPGADRRLVERPARPESTIVTSP